MAAADSVAVVTGVPVESAIAGKRLKGDRHAKGCHAFMAPFFCLLFEDTKLSISLIEKENIRLTNHAVSLDSFKSPSLHFFDFLDWNFIVTLVGLIGGKHLLDVSLRFSNLRDVAFYPMAPCIIRCECQPQISVVKVQ